MNVAFDNQAFAMQRIGGVSRYFSELSFNLKPLGVSPVYLMRYTENAHLVENKLLRNKIEWLPRRIGYRIERRINEFIRKLALTKKVDVYHPTYYDTLPIFDDVPKVTTVYDMIHEDFRHLLRDEKTIRLKKIAINSSKRLIAISESTKERIIDLLGVSADKIDVIHLATNFARICPLPRYDIPEHFVLFVGGRRLYKNFGVFVKAMSEIQQSGNNLHAVCVGNEFSAHELAKLESHSVTHLFHACNATDRELAYLYRKAKAFAFCSLEEGFGLPILEAFECGCPAILSDIPVFREVAIDAADFFDPYSPESLASSIRRVTGDDRLKEKLIVSGRKRGRDFSWHRTAVKTYEVYSKCMSLQ